jgi:hypothetical protein
MLSCLKLLPKTKPQELFRRLHQEGGWWLDHCKRRRTKPMIPTKPVPSKPSVLGSGTVDAVDPTKAVLAQPVPLKPTQMWTARPLIFAAVAFVTVKLRVVGRPDC